MTSISPTPAAPVQSPARRPDDDEIDLLALFGTLWDNRWLIIACTVTFTVVGVAYALLATPIYRATAMVQVEEKRPGLPGMDDISALLGESSTANTEIELIRSRTVLGRVVDDLGLDIQVQPSYFPLFGKAVARRFVGSEGELAEPLFGKRFGWGGEQLTVTRMAVPVIEYGEELELEATEEGWRLFNSKGDIVLEGVIGEPAESGDYALMVTELLAHPGTRFNVTLKRRLTTIIELQQEVAASETGKDSGIIRLSYDHEDYELASRVLDQVANNYVRQNVERNSAEAAQSLEFLRNQLPDVKKELEEAEVRLNTYQIEAESVDVTAEAQSLLDQIVELEKRISELQLQKSEIERRFTPSHPSYQAWESQMAELRGRRQELERHIARLPNTQQEVIRLRRDVEVGNEIYLQMLNNIQQLDIVRAGTVGNVRVVDSAAVHVDEPVKPKKLLIVIISMLIGGFIGIATVLIRTALNRGVENADQIEQMGLPVYAGIPLSIDQNTLELKKRGRRNDNVNRVSRLLAVSNPADLSIEALRSLRTSLHFALMDASNNILMMSGPSPGVGKSFVSANLAAVIAQANQKVLLIDADLRKGHIHDSLQLVCGNGLSDLLIGKQHADDAIRTTEVPGLYFLSRGTLPPNPSELLMSRRFSELLESVASDYDLVIIDTPPILAVTDAAIVGHHVGTTMLVVRFGMNPIKEIEHTRRRFEQNGIEAKGVIFNAVESKAFGYGGYGYYNYEYKSELTK